MTIPAGLNAACFADSGRTYAKFSASRTYSPILISNNGLTINSNASVNDAHKNAFLDIDKTTGIWSIECNLDSGIAAAGTPATLGITTVLTNGQIGQLNYSALSFPTYSGAWRVNNSLVTNVSDTKIVGGTNVLVLFDFNNRKLGVVKAGVVVWSAAIGTTEQLYIFTDCLRISGIQGQLTINTGQTAFSAANKTILAGISGANEGVWV